jgi:hypothetical protein
MCAIAKTKVRMAYDIYKLKGIYYVDMVSQWSLSSNGYQLITEMMFLVQNNNI